MMKNRNNALTMILLSLFVAAVALAFSIWLFKKCLDKFWGNAHIRFYGRIVDENGVGVPAVTVSGFIVAHRPGLVPVPFADNQVRRGVSARTDEDGFFRIDGGIGVSLHLVHIDSLKHPYFVGGDYYYSSSSGVSQFVPDETHPITLEASDLHHDP